MSTAGAGISTPTSASPISKHSTKTTTSSSHAATSSGSVIPSGACPGTNNTEFDVPDSSKVFLQLCDIDYSGTGEAEDIASVWTTTFDDCIIYCADFSGCTACGWGILAGDPGSEHRCWLKSHLGNHHNAKTGWQFAILQNS